MNTGRALLDVRDLTVGFAHPKENGPPGLAVDGVTFQLQRGKTLCLVGESGCGKSMTALSLLRLPPSPPALFLGGSVLFDGQYLAAMPESELRRIRGNRVGMVFQDPMTSLNPVIRVGDQMTEGMRLHLGLSAGQARAKAVSLLDRVGLTDPEARILDFPHQMSGGMRQRVMIGMALACDPDLIVADEPTTALDVTVQRQILALLRAIVTSSGSALLLITHDFGVVSHIADHVAVMYAGRIVEQGPATDILARPLHPYTIGLLHSRPGLEGGKKRLATIPGTVPGLWAMPKGCAFHPRCPEALARCKEDAPPLVAFPPESGERYSRCWRGTVAAQ